MFLDTSLDMNLKQLISRVEDRTLNNTTYMGVKTVKNPMDMWIYQEMIYELKPDIIVEIGVFAGGSTLYFAHILDNIDHGNVIGIDISLSRITDQIRNHKRITLLCGDACESLDQVESLIKPDDNVLIIEDSSHQYKNTLNVLRTYNHLVKVGGYFIVEDTICNHGLNGGPNPGPFEAVEKFVSENNSFAVDRGREEFILTWNPTGFIKRIR